MNLSLKISIAFNGQCEAAFRFYEQCLSGTITYMLTWGNSPVAAEAPPGWHTKIYHATLQIGDAAITGGDPPPDRYKKPEGFSFLLGMDDSVAAERVFQALAENGRIEMPLQKTFWAVRFGMVVDRFGIPWMVNCEQAGAAAGDD